MVMRGLGRRIGGRTFFAASFILLVLLASYIATVVGIAAGTSKVYNVKAVYEIKGMYKGEHVSGKIVCTTKIKVSVIDTDKEDNKVEVKIEKVKPLQCVRSSKLPSEIKTSDIKDEVAGDIYDVFYIDLRREDKVKTSISYYSDDGLFIAPELLKKTTDHIINSGNDIDYYTSRDGNLIGYSLEVGQWERYYDKGSGLLKYYKSEYHYKEYNSENDNNYKAFYVIEAGSKGLSMGMSKTTAILSTLVVVLAAISVYEYLKLRRLSSGVPAGASLQGPSTGPAAGGAPGS